MAGAWAHQNQYRRKRYLEQTMQRPLLAEQLRTDPVSGRRRCLAWLEGRTPPRFCRNAPIYGADVCRRHGGSTTVVKRLAAVRLVIMDAHHVVSLDEKLRTATKKDPREVLLQQVHEAAAMAAATREMAGDINVDSLLDPDADGHTKAVQTHQLFFDWNERAAKLSKQALDIGIDEQMVKLAEFQARAMVRALIAVLSADVLGLDEGRQKIARQLLGQQLRQLMPGVEETSTVTLNVDGEEIPYNPAMDRYTNLDAPKARARREAHVAHVVRRSAPVGAKRG